MRRFKESKLRDDSADGESAALGIDLGGSSVKAVTVRENGDLERKDHFEFDAFKRMEWGEGILRLVNDVEKAIGTRLGAIGISAPGLAARDRKSIVFMPGRLHGLEGLVWKDYLQRAHEVPVVNDGHAALLGEAWIGAARGFRNVIMLTLGTGVGGAAIVNGRLLGGHSGKAGHFGHVSLDPWGQPDICNAPGSLELAIGNCTVGERSEGKYKSTHDLIKAFGEGDKVAAEIWLTSVRKLAAGICSLSNILDPEAVIVGGGIARSGRALFEPLEEFFRPMEWLTGDPAKLLPAQLGEFAGAYGAAYAGLLKCRGRAPDSEADREEISLE